MTQRPFPNFFELQVRVDGVNATRCHRDAVDVAVRASTRFVNVVRRRSTKIRRFFPSNFRARTWLLRDGPMSCRSRSPSSTGSTRRKMKLEILSLGDSASKLLAEIWCPKPPLRKRRRRYSERSSHETWKLVCVSVGEAALRRTRRRPVGSRHSAPVYYSRTGTPVRRCRRKASTWITRREPLDCRRSLSLVREGIP